MFVSPPTYRCSVTAPPALAGAPVAAAAAAEVVAAAALVVTAALVATVAVEAALLTVAAERTLAVPVDDPVVAAEPAPQAASKAIEPTPAAPKAARRRSVRLVYLTTVVTFR